MSGAHAAHAALVILGAGSGTRVGAEVNKVLLPLAGRPTLAWSVRAALATPGVAPVVVVCREGEQDAVAAAIVPEIGEREVLLVVGGATRHASEQAALDAVAPRVRDGRVDVIAIHDGARPLLTPDLITRVVEAARSDGGAVPVVHLPGLAPREPAPPGSRARSGTLVGVQTPQAFRAAALLDAYAAAAAAGFNGTDTAASFERFAPAGHRIRAVPSRPENLKVTFAADVRAAERLLSGGR